MTEDEIRKVVSTTVEQVVSGVVGAVNHNGRILAHDVSERIARLEEAVRAYDKNIERFYTDRMAPLERACADNSRAVAQLTIQMQGLVGEFREHRNLPMHPGAEASRWWIIGAGAGVSFVVGVVAAIAIPLLT